MMVYAACWVSRESWGMEVWEASHLIAGKTLISCRRSVGPQFKDCHVPHRVKCQIIHSKVRKIIQTLTIHSFFKMTPYPFPMHITNVTARLHQSRDVLGRDVRPRHFGLSHSDFSRCSAVIPDRHECFQGILDHLNL